ncbi:bifunctional DedA family/phosphatase PAP2 family protein [Thioclava atlantica]|uniref:PA-phosphatase-like phosphoesterase n=1 Tax=Thioclava atlantica TaxID=1317124 RepID=A0A085TZQ6_9RHOB|nr:phosphatase PAP2 family protein [Thioclava atlantica]KFE36203.1 PA-phosphatase-like phosphoesterase [Thioclava atlantica]
MLDSIHQILPSLASLGLLGYWVIGAASALEAFFVTGLFVPGALVVDAGGFMVQRGLLDFLDLVWFVAIGSMLGGEASFWVGRHARRGMLGRWNVEEMRVYIRARRLFERYGGFALVLGRFLGPVAAFVPFAAAMSGMETRRFRIWNVVSGFPYALGHLAFGYFLGSTLTRMSPVMTRGAVFALVIVLVLVALWWTLRRLDRALPHLLALIGGLFDAIARHPVAGSLGARHPRLARFAVARLDRSQFRGLPATLMALAFAYLLALWIGIAFDFVRAEPIVQVDARLAQLMHLFWTPALIQFFTWVTALGDTRLVAALLVLALVWLIVLRRTALILGLVVSLGTDLASVALFKASFGRPRSALGYFTETSGSFPSGHATLSVAFYGMLFYLLWRLRRLGPVTAALLAATTAFLIGLSRLYLVEHYLSDVLAGWTLGALCLVIGIAVAEWRRSVAPPRPRNLAGWGKALMLVLSLALVGYAGLRVTDYTKTRNPRPSGVGDVTLSQPGEVFTREALPVNANTLTGERSFPINIAFYAQDAQQLTGTLAPLGWMPGHPASLGTLARAAFANIRGQTGAAVAPLFWDNRPDDLSFSTDARAEGGVPPRLRLWATRFVDGQSRRLFLGVLSRDDGLDLEDGAPAPDVARALAKTLAAEATGASRQAMTVKGRAEIPLLLLK